MANLVEQFVGTLPERIAELRSACDRLDWEQLTLLAHRLKGAGGSYGYPDISRLAKIMEDSFRLHSADGFATWIGQLEQLSAAARAGLQT